MALPLLMPSPRQRFVDNLGLPLVNGMVYTYASGTSDQLPAFQDSDGLVPHKNPIRLDERGEATIYWLGNYRVNVRNAIGVQIPGYPVDNFNAIDSQSAASTSISALTAQFLSSIGASLIGFLQAGVGAVLRTLQSKVREIEVSVTDFGAKGDGVTDDTAAIQKAYNTSLRVRFPATSSYYKISDTITYRAEHISYGDGPTLSRVVMTTATKFAFACDPVLPSSAAGNTYEIQGGGFFDLDIRARYGIRLGKPNMANPPTYDYASFADFIAASPAVQNFRVHGCVLMPDNDYSAGYTYIAASPNWNTVTPPTISDLYSRGVGVLLSQAYRADVRGNTMKFYGMAVWSFGSDFCTVENNRLANNLRHVNMQGTWTAGYQGKIMHNDLLASYRWGGVYTRWVNHVTIEDNYFENSGADTNSTIGYYIVDTGVCTSLLGNRFDDYGSTKTTGPLVVFNGPSGTICDHNRVADNRPNGAGTLSVLSIDASNWSPAATGLFCAWGLVQMGENENSFPRVRHPLVQYHLDGNPLEWSPLQASRDLSYRDFSGGGVMNSFKFSQDAAGLWYLQPGPFQNGVNMKPRQNQLTKGVNFVVTIRARCTVATAPFTAFWTINWINAAGTSTALYGAYKTYATNTAIEEFSQAVALPAITEGYFSVNIDQASANLYGITITQA